MRQNESQYLVVEHHMLSQRYFVGKITFLSYAAFLKAKIFTGSIHEPSEKHTVVTPTFVGVDMIKRLKILSEQMLNGVIPSAQAGRKKTEELFPNEHSPMHLESALNL